MNFKIVVIIFGILTTPLQAAKILSIFGIPAPSQYSFIEPLLKELARRGHQITSISNFPQKEPVENFRDVVVKENNNLFDGYQNFTIDDIEDNYYEIIEAVYNTGFQMCLNILDNPSIQKMFASEKFDLILLEVSFSEAFFGLAEHFKAPIVSVTTLGTMTEIDHFVGNISPISYIPNLMLPLKEMNFWQRFLNLMVHLLEWPHYYLKYMPVQKQIYKKYFPNAKLSLEEAKRNVALVLLNDHFSFGMPRPYVTNMIEVAGLHINTKPDPLPKDLQTILDNAKDGVIFITIDSIISPTVKEIFLKQFQNLKQIVIWKSYQEIYNVPSNVYVSYNYSQTSILGHPNMKLFICQGGYLNTIESIYHGIPVLGVAPTVNAEDYIDFIRKIGNGLSVKEKNLSAKSLTRALDQLLNSSYYSQFAKLLSKRFRDQQNTPMERAVYWVEYVLRHNGAGHLRNMGQNLTWYQYYSIDVLLLLFCIIFLIIFVIYAFIRLVTKLAFPVNFKIKRD